MVLKPDHSRTEKVWKKIKLHGSQTIQFHLYVTHSIWRDVKLQGAQTDIHYIVKSFKVWKGVRRLVILNAKEQIPRRMTGTRSIAFIFLP